MSSKHEKYLVFDSTFIAERKDMYVRTESLGPAIYDAQHDPYKGITSFTKVDLNMDEILELPDSLMKKVVTLIEEFWSSEKTEKYKLYGLVQKLGILLHGMPGTGKTVIMARIARKVIELGGIILFNPRVATLSTVLKVVREIEPTKKIVVLWEEFDSIIHQSESELLCLLDGEIQLDNIVYLGTTNYISKIPARIKNRPSRFAKVWEIKTPSKAARRHYFEHKLKTDEDKAKYLDSLVEYSDNFTIDQCKDLLINVVIFDETIASAVKNINEISSEHGYGIDDYNEEQAKEIFSKNAKSMPKNPLKPI